MPDLPDLSGYEQWWREHVRQPDAGSPDWFRIAAEDKKKPRKAEVWIYDRIGRSWFDEGTDAKGFAKKLAGLDVDEITLHINSPGGDAFDGVAIYNTLHDHQADVHVVVDGLAASAASYIAQAGKTVKMNKAAQMMIHRASGICLGNAKDMADFADVLGKLDTSIAGIYHSRAGGDLDDWLAAMTGETWYTAAEAVEAGLADESVEDTPAEPKARAVFDLRIFAYAGRDKAPAPRIRTQAPDPPAEPSADPPTPQEGAGMDPAKLREALGLKTDASDEDVTKAITAEGLVQAAVPPVVPNPGAPPATEPPEKKPPAVTDEDQIVVDTAVLKALQASARRGDEAYKELQKQRRDTVLTNAIAQGKFPQARRSHYEQLWDADPEGTEERVKNLAPGLIPVDPTGYPGSDGVIEDQLYARLYPEDTRVVSGRG